MLVEPVRRRLHREMRDALARQFVERAVQRHRIGRRQRAIDLALRRHHADGADARGLVAERIPDLPGERRDRSLAAGAGDRGDHLRLARIEPRRGQRQRAARVLDLHERRACGQRCRLASRPITAAAPAATAWPTNAQPVGLAAGHRDEQIAGLHRAAVRRDAADLDGVRRARRAWQLSMRRSASFIVAVDPLNDVRACEPQRSH